MASTSIEQAYEVADHLLPVPSDCSTFSNPRFFSSDFPPVLEKNASCNFITFLAAMQRFRVPFLPLKWESRRPLLGRGGTSQVNQALMTRQTSFAFKRIAVQDKLGKTEEEVLQAVMNEIAVLRHPVVRNHPGILELQGICWDIPPHEQQSGVETLSHASKDSAIWPVLVFERSHFGDLNNFARLLVGRKLGIKERLKICSDIGHTIAFMQQNSIVHGDIKPENILIFQEKDGSFAAKVADFGFSIQCRPDNSRMVLPRSLPWYAPECDLYPDFTPAQAVKTDVFSFGMLCLWFIFERYFSGAVPFPPTQLLREGIDTFEDASSSLKFIHHVKTLDALRSLASHLVMAETGADAESRQRLLHFFEGCLPTDPERRNTNISDSLKQLDPLRRLGLTSNDPPPEPNFPTDEDFQLCSSLSSFYYFDYRLRSYIVRSLEKLVAENPTSPMSVQLAVCYQLGFGISDGIERLRSLLYDMEAFCRQLDKIKTTASFRGGLMGPEYRDLVDTGYNLPIHPGLYYMTQGIPETAKRIIKKELEGLETLFGVEHPAPLLLKSTLAGIAYHQCRFREAEELEVDVLNILSRTVGEEHTDTITAMGNLAVSYAEQGRLAEAEDLLLKVKTTCETRFGLEHNRTLVALKNLAMVYYDQCQWDKSEELLVDIVKIKQRIFGEEHQSTIMDLSDLASTYRKQGRVKEAETLEDTFMDTYEGILDENSDTALLALLVQNPESCVEFGVELFDDDAVGDIVENPDSDADTDALPGKNNSFPPVPVLIKSLSGTYRKLGLNEKAKMVDEMFHDVWSGEGDWISSDKVNSVLDMEVLLPVCKLGEAEKFGIEVLPVKRGGEASGSQQD